MNKIIKIIIVVVIAWLVYDTILFPPNQKTMNKLVDNQEKITDFNDGFENVKNFLDLFPDNFSRWHEIIRQDNTRSLRRPILFCMVSSYYCHITDAEKEKNSITLDKHIFHEGKQSLKFKSQAFKRQWLGESKISIRRHLLDFKNGDDFYFSGWFYLESDKDLKNDTTIERDTKKEVDDNHNFLSFWTLRAENRRVRYHGEPGIGIFLENRNFAYLDITNWLPKPEPMKQELANEMSIPKNKWFELKIHLKLSNSMNGKGEVWIDDHQIISKKGPTLPEASTVYSILELGIVSNMNESYSQTIYVDDINVSNTGFHGTVAQKEAK